MARLQTEVGETEAALREERLHSAESYEARIADLQEQVTFTGGACNASYFACRRGGGVRPRVRRIGMG